MAFEVWGSMFSGKRVIIHTGNVALVSNLNLKTYRYKRAMYLLWRLVLQGLLFNMQFAAPILAYYRSTQCQSRLFLPAAMGSLQDQFFRGQTLIRHQYPHRFCT